MLDSLEVGRSIFRFVDIYAADVVEAVAEFFEDEKMSAAAVESEDVWPMARWIVGEVNEDVEFLNALGAFERVVGDVDELLIFVK